MYSRIMLSSVAILLATPTLADVAKHSCASTKDSKPLKSVAVFDGPVKDDASLVPDNSNSNNGTWTFDSVYEDGRFITLRCVYAGGATVDIEIKDRLKTCKSKTTNKVLSVSCS